MMQCGKCNSGCDGNKNKVQGNFVPLIQNKIDLASSTIVNNPIIPANRPSECNLKNKKYQILIGFDKDPNGQIWPEWMKAPLINALGDPYGRMATDISSYIDDKISGTILPRVNTAIHEAMQNHMNQVATLDVLGHVKSSDRINQISVINGGVMEINDIGFSKLSQDCNIILQSPSIEEFPNQADEDGNGENFF